MASAAAEFVYSKIPSLYVCIKCGYARKSVGLLRHHRSKCTELNYAPVQKFGDICVIFMKIFRRKNQPERFEIPVCIDCYGSVNTNLECHACIMNGDVTIPPELKLSAVTSRQMEELMAPIDSEDEFV